jgi:hypothetical protein
MEINHKLKLSSDLLVTKLMMLFGALYSLKLLFDEHRNNIDIDFKTDLEYKIFFIIMIAFLVYFLTRPGIFYDELNLYIKKINSPEIIVSLKDIKSIFNNPLTGMRGNPIITIEYIDNLSEKNSIKFSAPNSLDKLKHFVTL